MWAKFEMSVSTSERIQSYSRILNKKTKPKPCFNLLRDNTFLCNYKIMSQLNHLEKKKKKKDKNPPHTHTPDVSHKSFSGAFSQI